MNISERTIKYYDSPDFKSNYMDCLYESYMNNEREVIGRILNLFNVSNYETEKYLKNYKVINREQAVKIYQFIADNFEIFCRSFNGWHVGYTSLESISYGEQEEQLSALYNHRTKKQYSLKYLKRIFNESCFYVSGDFAYYDLSSSGIHVDLINTELDIYLTTL